MSKQIFLIREELTRSISMSDIFSIKDSKNIGNEETFKSIYEDAKAKYVKKNKDAAYYVFEQCKATHLGYVNSNLSLYPAEFGDQNARSWVEPYEKPVLVNHDMTGSPLGRHVSAQYVPFTLSESQKKSIKVPKGVVLTHSVITDWGAMDKILDKRFLTVSVSGNSPNLKCSICGQDWLNIKDGEDMCTHEPGQYYNGKLCYKITGPLSYIERSFVNNPADQSGSHAAILTNFEMMLPEAQAHDAAYIAKNMLYSKESPIIRDSSGYTLFLSRDEQGDVAKGKTMFAFSLGSRVNVTDSIVDESDNDDDISSFNDISGVREGAGHLDANLSTQSEATTVQSNAPINSKEQDVMDWKTVSIPDALENVVGLKSFIETQVADKVKEVTAEAVAAKEAALADTTAAKTALDEAKTKIEDLTKSSIATTTDSIITVMADLHKPQYEKIIKDAAGDKAKFDESIKVFKDKLLARDLSSLVDMLGDLREERDLLAVEKSTVVAKDETLNQPVANGVTAPAPTTSTVADNANPAAEPKSTPVVATARRRLPISL